MTYQPVTPFRRTMDAALMAHQAAAKAPAPLPSVDKWEALRVLSSIAKAEYSLNDRDISVLQALLSFLPSKHLEGADPAALVVFPSNASLSDRLNGMPGSTLRRHLARLVDAGLLIRRDSPNGKRFSRHTTVGRVAFGFDLRPLLVRHAAHCEIAAERQAEADRIRSLREEVSLMRRDLASLAGWGRQDGPDLATWDAFDDLARLAARDLRRKLDEESLKALRKTLLDALNTARDCLEPQVEPVIETAKPGTSDSQNERHHQNSIKDIPDSEKGNETDADAPQRSRLPLRMILSVCTEFLSFAPERPRHWHDFVAIAETLRPMLGIAPDAWAAARRSMGAEQAAVTLAAMMQRMKDIHSPGAYLRHLAKKAEGGSFSVGPMIRALTVQAA